MINLKRIKKNYNFNVIFKIYVIHTKKTNKEIFCFIPIYLLLSFLTQEIIILIRATLFFILMLFLENISRVR